MKTFHQCDDGNVLDGDGCSSECLVQDGWECVGGNETSRDVCTSAVSIQSFVQSQTTPSQFSVTFTQPVLDDADISSLLSFELVGVDRSLYNFNFAKTSSTTVQITVILQSSIEFEEVMVEILDSSLLFGIDLAT